MSQSMWKARAEGKGLSFVVVNAVASDDVFRGDMGRIRQILFNLIGNAVKFTDRGRIEVKVDRIQREDGKPFLRFEVKDTGIGLSAEQRAKLFQPFTQASGRLASSGVGMTL